MEKRRPDARADRPSTGRLWRSLNFGWALYFALMFTVGRYAEYQRAVMWGGGALLAAPTIMAMLRKRIGVPRSTWMLWGFVAWSLLGLAFAPDRSSFWRYMGLILELATIVTLVSLCIARSQRVRVWYFAFLVAGVVSATAGEMREAAPLALAGVAIERQGGIAGNPNALGLVSYLGVLGGGLLAGMERRGWRTALLLTATSLPAIGVLLSASRAAFLATILTVIGWPIVCGWRRLRHPWVVATGLLLASLAFSGYIVRIFESSTMGRRVLRLEEGKDRSARIRTNLAREGLDLAIENPILGVGLGQFAEASGTGLYAHGDWVEVLSTTGVPGFSLYVGGMLVVGWRLFGAVNRFRGTGTEDLVRAALLALLVVLATGAVTWPHSLTIHSMFLLGVVFGTAEMVRQRGPVIRARRPDGALPPMAREFARAS
jgi:O-antigen ligase